MTIAEKIVRAKTDLDKVYKAGQNSIISGVGTVIDNSMSVFKQVPINSISHCYISSIGGHTYEVPDENTGLAPIRLENAKPTAIRVYGANLIPFPYYSKSNTSNGITTTVNDDGSITFNGTATANTAFILSANIPLSPNESYILSASDSDNWVNGVTCAVAVKYDENLPSAYTNITFNIPAKVINKGYRVSDLRITISSGTVCNNLVFKPMINIGTTALPYAPYREPITYEIPESITSLPSFGIGLYDNEFNEVDLVNGKYYQRCNTKTFVGTETFKLSTLGSRSRFNINVPADCRYWAGNIYLSVQKCDYLESDATVNIINANDSVKNKMTQWQNGWFFYVDGAQFPDLATWQAYLAEHNMKVVYELESEVITDIDISGFNPLIEIEAGGAIEFITDSGYAPNSTVVFQTIM